MIKAIFAIPGDMHRRTGGFIYEATLLATLNKIGCETEHLELPDSFPDPTPQDTQRTLEMLRAVPATCPIILDGLVYGSIDPEGLAQVQAPLIAMIHHPLGLETGLDPARAAELLQNESATLRHAAHVMVPSPHTAEILTRDFAVPPDRITIALPGFHRPNVTPDRDDPPLILSVGLLAPRKGHDVLIDALSTLTDLSWRAEIVGNTHDPAYAAELAQRITDLGLQGRVLLAGELSRHQLEARYAAASLFALATRYEGYGMVLSEAMLHALPVVSCAVGAVPDTVGEAGLLTPVDDPTAFATALRKILDDRAFADDLSQKAKQKADGLMTWEETAAIFEQVIEELRAAAAKPHPAPDPPPL